MLLSNELLEFSQAADADDIVMAFNRMQGPSRTIMVNHLIAMSGLTDVIEGSIVPSVLPAPTEAPMEAPVLAPVMKEETLLPDWLSLRERKIIGALTAETVENRILEMKLRNMSIDRISAYVEMPRSEVITILRTHQNNGIKVGPMGDFFKDNPKAASKAAKSRNARSKPVVSRSATTDDQKVKIVRMRSKGIAPSLISKSMDLSPPTVYNVLYNHKQATNIEFPSIVQGLLVTNEDLQEA